MILIVTYRLQGPSTTLVLTPSPNLPARRYTLPTALLRAHSVYFRTEINRLDNAVSAENKPAKKRKFADGTDEVIVDTEVSELTIELTRENQMTMHLKDVDHAIFGLFLKFAYTGKYAMEPDLHAKGRHVSPYSTTQVGSGMQTAHNQLGLAGVPASMHGKSSSIPPTILPNLRSIG